MAQLTVLRQARGKVESMVTVQSLQKGSMMLPNEQALRTTMTPDFFRGPVDWVLSTQRRHRSLESVKK